MARRVAITRLDFQGYKAFSRFTLHLGHMNILVGPNNCGKSTVVGAFRLLTLGIRRAKTRRAESVTGPSGPRPGWRISDEYLPVSLENAHTDYEEIDSVIEFHTSNGGQLTLLFPEAGGCCLFVDGPDGVARNRADIDRALPMDIQVVPVLGPVAHQEPLLEEDTVRKGLTTTRASRHFRNYWHLYPEGFSNFAALVRNTWPGMEIRRPELLGAGLSMFCLEKRISRELYWSGFGFQIWCQLLTHIARCSSSSLLVMDEPETYLHPDIQRQLLGILRDCDADILMATHSTEIMSESDPAEIVLIDKERRSSERLRDVEGVQTALDAVGSVQNITLTRLAKNRRILFAEAESDHRLIRRFAKVLGFTDLAAGTDLTPLASGGFSSWERINALASGVESALGAKIHVGALFDRDYFCDGQISKVLDELQKHLEFAHVHERKEFENYLLVPEVLDRAIEKASQERARRTGKKATKPESSHVMLRNIARKMKREAYAQYIAKYLEFHKRARRDQSDLAAEAIAVFEEKWRAFDTRMSIVPGKRMLSALRTAVMKANAVNLTDYRIISEFRREEVPKDLVEMMSKLDEFRRTSV